MRVLRPRLCPHQLGKAGGFVLIVILLLLAHVWLIAPIVQNGDGAVYNEQIEQQNLAIRTPHIGYMILGIASNSVLPFDTERNLNLMCLVFASLGALALCLIARKHGATWMAAAFSATLALALQPYLRGAVMAEVDGVACALILISVAAWVSGQRVLSGIAFGWAMLITPLTALSLPVIVFTRTKSETTPSRRLEHGLDLAIFASSALAVYSPFVLHFWQDYWNGGRGLLRAPRQSWDTIEHIMRSIRFFASNTLPWLAIGLAGLVKGLGRRSSIALGTLVATVIAAVFGERFLDVPVQLPQACLLIVLTATLVDRIARRKIAASAFIALWACSAIPAYAAVYDEVHGKVEINETYRAMARQTPRLMVIGLRDSWIDGLPFERLIYHRTKLGLGLDFRQFASSSQSIAQLRRGYALWLMAPDPGALMVPFHRGWRKEYRPVRGHSYEVWLPTGGG